MTRTLARRRRGKSADNQVWPPEFDPWHPLGGGRELTCLRGRKLDSDGQRVFTVLCGILNGELVSPAGKFYHIS